MFRYAWVALFLLAACGDNFSTQDAYAACEEILPRVDTTEVTDENFNACVACYEDCGAGCEQTSDPDVPFACPAD